jgi:hypothetical protein
MMMSRASSGPTSAIPDVTEAAALADKVWFSNHPSRRLRARCGDGGLWIVRRRPQGVYRDVFLRAFAPAISRAPVTEIEAAVAWYRAVFPDWPPERCRAAARNALRKPRRPS